MHWFRHLFQKHQKTSHPADELPHGMQFSRKGLSYDEVQEQWQALESRLSAATTAGNTVRGVPLYIQVGRTAAAIAGLVLMAGLGWWYYPHQSWVRNQTAFGQTRRIVLPDQSVVVLNANSSLRYRKDWTRDQVREVWLEGEGFFQVRRQPGKAPFWVHSDQLRVEVLGTQFNVNSRRGNTRVVLQSGKVRLTADEPEAKSPLVEMKPDELVDFAGKGKPFRKRMVKASRYLAWQQRQMVFDDTPLREVALMLEDFYGVKVKIAHPELAERKLTGAISTRDPEVCFQAIASLLEAKVTRRDGQVIFAKPAEEYDQ